MAKRPYPSKVNNEDSTSSAKKAKQSNAREAAALSLMALRHPNVELADSIMQNQQQQQPNDTTSSNTLTNKAVRVIQTLGQHDCIPQALFRCQNKDPSAVFFVPIHHCTTNALSASSSVSGDQNDENNHEEQEASDSTTTSSNQQMPPLRMLSQSVSVLGLGRSTRLVTPAATSTTTASHKRSWNKRQDHLLPVLLPPLLTHAKGSCPLSPAPLLAPHLAKRAQPLWCTPEKEAEDSPQ